GDREQIADYVEEGPVERRVAQAGRLENSPRCDRCAADGQAGTQYSAAEGRGRDPALSPLTRAQVAAKAPQPPEKEGRPERDQSIPGQQLAAIVDEEAGDLLNRIVGLRRRPGKKESDDEERHRHDSS